MKITNYPKDNNRFKYLDNDYYDILYLKKENVKRKSVHKDYINSIIQTNESDINTNSLNSYNIKDKKAVLLSNNKDINKLNNKLKSISDICNLNISHKNDNLEYKLIKNEFDLEELKNYLTTNCSNRTFKLSNIKPVNKISNKNLVLNNFLILKSSKNNTTSIKSNNYTKSLKESKKIIKSSSKNNLFKSSKFFNKKIKSLISKNSSSNMLKTINFGDDKEGASKIDHLKKLEINHKNEKMKNLKKKVINLLNNKIIIDIHKVVNDQRMVEKLKESIYKRKFHRNFSCVDTRKNVGIYINSKPELINDENIYSLGFEDKFQTPEEILTKNFNKQEIEILRDNKKFFKLENTMFNNLKLLNKKNLIEKLEEEEKNTLNSKNIILQNKSNLMNKNFLNKNYLNTNSFKNKDVVIKTNKSIVNKFKAFKDLKNDIISNEKKKTNKFSFKNFIKSSCKNIVKNKLDETKYKGQYKEVNHNVLPTVNIFYDNDYSLNNIEDNDRENLLNKIFN